MNDVIKDEKQQETKKFAWFLLELIVIFIVIENIFGRILSYRAHNGIFPPLPYSPSFIAVLFVLVYIIVRRKNILKVFDFDFKFNYKILIPYGIFILGYFVFGFALYLIIKQYDYSSSTSPLYFLYFISGALLCPIGEEVFCRGLILKFLNSKWNKIIGLIISTIVFSIFHDEHGIHLIRYSFLGLLFGIIYLKTNNIIFPIIVHGILNLITISIQETIFNNFELLEKGFHENKILIIIFFVFFLIYVYTGFHIIISFLKKEFKKKSYEEII
ncbi:CPBP family intramembrane metalloprotease [Candidatus Dependentiae bacterium]|nr:CPBP family intramembrane metalloprotease [Candidatus Dependentiae bacterium]